MKKELVYIYKLVTEVESPILEVLEELRGYGDAKIESVLVASRSGRQVLEFRIIYTVDALEPMSDSIVSEIEAIGDVLTFVGVDVTMREGKGKK